MEAQKIPQLDFEIQSLTKSYKDLEEAKLKFKESLDAIEVQRKLPKDKSILVPLTGSMYVPGHIADTQKYFIDIGTQYLVEKDADGASDYFRRKMKFIDVQLAKFSQLLKTRVQAKNQARQEAIAAAAAATAPEKLQPAASTSGATKI